MWWTLRVRRKIQKRKGIDMKKIVAILLCLVMILSVAACGKKANEQIY